MARGIIPVRSAFAAVCLLRRVGLGAAAWFLTGCLSPQQVFVADVDASAWSRPATVSVHNTDTTALRTLRIVVRSNDAFRTDTLTLRIAADSPDSVCYEEPFMLRIAREPKAASLRRETDMIYRTGVVLSDTGIYRFTFTPSRPVQGIETVGIHLTND